MRKQKDISILLITNQTKLRQILLQNWYRSHSEAKFFVLAFAQCEWTIRLYHFGSDKSTLRSYTGPY